MVPRCGGCCELLTRCRCERNPCYPAFADPRPKPEPFDPAARGFHAVYRPGQRNHCPGCGREHWDVRRSTAECSFCGTALPLGTQPGVGPLA